ncbi:MAG: hypothetical protein PHV44_07455, partial [Candidatus Omnitrophica bacterium]|nr:hypothetical protein [Candidatus Omnitrophota bacterium]
SFGTGSSVIYSVPEGQSRTYTLSIYLNQTLPTGADGKAIAFSVNPAVNLSVDSPGSAFAASGAITGSLAVDVTASKFIITGDSATVAAGAGSSLIVKAADINNNIDTGYSGAKEIIFSGANSVTSGGATYNPTCTNYSEVDVAFGNITLIDFISGQSASLITMKLYKAESAAITAKTSDSVVTTANAFIVAVTGGAASKLSWKTQPQATAAANAPWTPFKVSVVDAYGNTAPSAINVTVAPAGGTLSTGATSSVAAVSGTAEFDNFAVYCASYPATVTLEASAAGITGSGASDNVTIVEKYAITMKVFDSVNGSSLTELTLKIIDSGTGQLVTGLTNPITGNSPFSFNLPYGEYSFNFNKTSYVESTVDKSANVSADAVDGAYDSNIGWTVFLTSVAESQADYKILSNFVYDESSDQITALVRLEKRGQQITSNDITTLKTSTLDIFNSSDATNPKYSASLAAPDANGNYYFIIDEAVSAKGFVGGRDYFAKMTILYGGSDLSTNVTYSAANDFTISVTESLKTLTAQIASSVASEAARTRTELASKIESTAEATQEKIAEVKTEADNILTAAVTTIPAQINAAQGTISATIASEVAPQIKSSVLNTENLAKTGDTLVIRYRTLSGLSPVIDVYNADNKQVISKEGMEENGDTGIYEYAVTFLQGWGKGDFTVICSEPTNGVMDGLTISVIKTSLEEVYDQVTTVPALSGEIDDLKQAAEAINSQFSTLQAALGKIGNDLLTEGVTKQGVDSSAGLEAISVKLSDVAKQVKQVSDKIGVNLEKIYEVSAEKKDDVVYLKNKTQELKAVMDLTKKMVDNIANKPVVQSWYEFKKI